MFSTRCRTDSLEVSSAAMLVGFDIGAQSVEAPDIDEDLEGRRGAPRHDVPTNQKTAWAEEDRHLWEGTSS